VSCCWIFLHDGAILRNGTTTLGCVESRDMPPLIPGSDVSSMHFTLELGWCWLPSEACWYEGFSQAELNGLRLGCSYALLLIYFVLALAALISLIRSNSAVGGTVARVPLVVFLRLSLMILFPFVAYGFGAASRFTGDEHRGLDAFTSILICLCGFWNSVVFVATEDVGFALMKRLRWIWCHEEDGGRLDEEPGSPSLPDRFTAPNGFTAAIRFLSCDLAVGEARSRSQFPDVDTLLLRSSGDAYPAAPSSTRRVLEM
jgi:hypothetical protein